MENVNILYEDNDILVCHKQAGIAVQTHRIGQADMESELKNYRISKGEKPYIGIIHRLDQPVEGLLVFAKNPASAANLSKQVAARQIAKYYYALVHMPEESGMPGDSYPQSLRREGSQLEDSQYKYIQSENYLQKKFQQGDLVPENSQKKNQQMESAWITLTDYLVRDGKTNTARVVPETASGAKRAVLEYRIIKCCNGIALLDIHLHTGRHHQIRVQMAHARMPLVGDRKYGKDNSANRGLALCAYRLEFTHPTSGEKLHYEITPKWVELG